MSIEEISGTNLENKKAGPEGEEEGEQQTGLDLERSQGDLLAMILKNPDSDSKQLEDVIKSLTEIVANAPDYQIHSDTKDNLTWAVINLPTETRNSLLANEEMVDSLDRIGVSIETIKQKANEGKTFKGETWQAYITVLKVLSIAELKDVLNNNLVMDGLKAVDVTGSEVQELIEEKLKE